MTTVTAQELQKSW